MAPSLPAASWPYSFHFYGLGRNFFWCKNFGRTKLIRTKEQKKSFSNICKVCVQHVKSAKADMHALVKRIAFFLMLDFRK